MQEVCRPDKAVDGLDSAGQWLVAAERAVLPQVLDLQVEGRVVGQSAYFNGHSAGGHLSVLIIWTVLGLVAIFTGRHVPFRFTAGPA